jgi:hypothetical protein
MATPAPASREKSHLRNVTLAVGVVLFLLYVAICAFFYFQQDAMTFPAPTQYRKATPSNVGIPFEDLRIPVDGSEWIHCWWIPAASQQAGLQLPKYAFEPKKVVTRVDSAPSRSTYG